MPAFACATLLLLSAAAQEGSVNAHPPRLLPATGRVEQPVELGQVQWRRDFDAALAEAK